MLVIRSELKTPRMVWLFSPISYPLVTMLLRRDWRHQRSALKYLEEDYN